MPGIDDLLCIFGFIYALPIFALYAFVTKTKAVEDSLCDSIIKKLDNISEWKFIRDNTGCHAIQTKSNNLAIFPYATQIQLSSNGDWYVEDKSLSLHERNLISDKAKIVLSKLKRV